VSTNQLRTNVYCLGIGATGCGKGPGIKYPALLLEDSGLTEFIGPGEWKSDSGLRAAVVAAPSHCCMIDEFTKMLPMMVGDRAAPHLVGIKTLIISLFDKANASLGAAVYADRKEHRPDPLREPNFCLYGVGPPEDLTGSLDRGALADGFLNRFLVFFSDDRDPERVQVESVKPPAELIAAMKQLHLELQPAGNLAGSTPDAATATGCRAIGMEPAAFSLWSKEVREEQRERVARLRRGEDENQSLANLWVRYQEHVGKLALIRSAADDCKRKIRIDDVAWARDLVLWCLERMQAVVETRLSDSKVEKDTKRVRRMIDAAGVKGVNANAITRQTQWLRRGERKDILQTLLESGQIVSPPRRRGDNAATPTVYYGVAVLSDAELAELLGQSSPSSKVRVDDSGRHKVLTGGSLPNRDAQSSKSGLTTGSNGNLEAASGSG
jgi:hypothetical protein